MQVCSLSPVLLFQDAPPDALAWALKKESRIIGQCLALPAAVPSENSGLEILHFTIAESWRGKGYGTFFIKKLLQQAGKIPSVWIPEDAPRVRSFFARFGFTPSGRRRETSAGPLCCLIRWQEPQINALSIAHDFLRSRVLPGSFVIDATAGRGRDTAFLCRLVGSGGKVLAVDIQQEAVDVTNELLRQRGYDSFAKALLASHADLDHYAEAGTVDAIMFNLGYLPGGDHSLFTESSVSLPAIRSALELLRPGGVMTVCIYRGGLQGEDEKNALLPFLRGLDARRYTVLITDFANRTGPWPIPVCIVKHTA